MIHTITITEKVEWDSEVSLHMLNMQIGNYLFTVQPASKTINDILDEATERLRKIDSSILSEEEPLVIHGQGSYTRKIYPSDLRG